MTLKSILEICDKDERICIGSDNRSIFIPNENGEVDYIYAVPLGNLLKYAPEEVLDATVLSLKKGPTYLAFGIECPPSNNTVIDKYGNIFVNCKPTDWKFYSE